MYIPSIHKPDELHDVYDYIRQNGFATLVGQSQDKSNTRQNCYRDGAPIASHIPLHLVEYAEKYYLTGHVSIANPIKNCFDESQDMLAIFMQSHAYISSSWYDHINVPTWNYVAVHVYGKARKLSDDEVYHSINDLVNQYEDGRKARFRLSDMSTQMARDHLKGVVGFELKIDRIETSHKLSQNRKDKDYNNIIHQLENEGDQGSVDIADKMKKLRS